MGTGLAPVTGGAGFIGSHLVAGLLARGCRVPLADITPARARLGFAPGVSVREGLRRTVAAFSA